MWKATRCDSPSELPGFHLGTRWTVRIAIGYGERGKKIIQDYFGEEHSWRNMPGNMDLVALKKEQGGSIRATRSATHESTPGDDATVGALRTQSCLAV